MRVRVLFLLVMISLVSACTQPKVAENSPTSEANLQEPEAPADPKREPKSESDVPRQYKPDLASVEEDMLAIYDHFVRIAADAERKTILRDIATERLGGAKLFGEGVKRGLFDREIILLLALSGGPDHAANPDTVAETGQLPADCCSYCSPPASEFLMSLGMKGKRRRVVLCPNARNWVLFGEAVPMIVSDRHEIQWVTWADLSEEFGITEEEWADPAGKLFGKKAPFQHTYE
ncbi:MAG: hypothetical protein KDB68_14330 [Planctomycetes bacterium]|nr:hypothetical protein [Planctomycetota bacterium]